MKIFLALLLTVSVLCGATVEFRSGKILRAELSTKAPAGLKLVKPIYPDLPAKPVYAAVTLLFNEGRGLSLHDYAIHIFGKNYPCVAVMKENKFILVADESQSRYDWKSEERTSPRTRYTLFFMLAGNEVGSVKGRNEELIFKPLFPPSERFEKAILFKNVGDTPLTAPGRVPHSGLMTEKK